MNRILQDEQSAMYLKTIGLMLRISSILFLLFHLVPLVSLVSLV